MEEIWLRVGEVAKRTGLTVRTLHHYDAIGLLSPEHESAAGYRLYSDADLRRLLAITHLKGLGLSLDEIADALDSPDFDAATVVEAHITAVEARISAERELLNRLRSLRTASEVGWDEVLDVIALSQRLRHPDDHVRFRAVLDAPASVPLDELIERLLVEPSDGVRENLTWAIARHPDAVAALLPHLRSRSTATRRQVAHVLSKIRDAAAVEPLASALDDPEASVAAKAAFALGQIGGDRAIAALASTLGDGPASVRTAVVDALGRLGEAASSPLTAALDSPDAARRADAADALAHVADPSTVDALTLRLRDPDASVRIAALSALGALRPHSDAAIQGAVHGFDARLAAYAERLLGVETPGGATASSAD